MIDEDFPTICICALRYALGRETYMPRLVQRYIKRNIADIPKYDIEIMIEDIESKETLLEVYPHSLGNPVIDAPGWIAFKEWLREKL